jgi:hypothetical protein
MRAVHSIVQSVLVSLLLPAFSPVHASTGVYGLDTGYGGLFYSQDFRKIYNSVCLDNGGYSCHFFKRSFSFFNRSFSFFKRAFSVSFLTLIVRLSLFTPTLI